MARTRRAGAFLAALSAAAGLGALLPARAAPSATFRIEVHALPTLTLTRPQTLTASFAAAPPATIAGELRLPAGAPTKMPAVVMLHGDAGAIANQVAWIEALNGLGIAVFTVDSFTGRGAIAPEDSVASMPDSVGGIARVIDAERALAVLARHPRIDPQRIAVMGFSSGANTVLVAAQTRFASTFGSAGTGFAAYIALYPDCNVRLIDDTRTEPGPQRIFIGEADVLTSAATCKRYEERLKLAGVDIAVTSFPGAHHGFDNVANRELIRMAGVPSGAACNREERVRGELVNVDTGRPLTLQDACIGHGLVAGYDAAADAATKAAVKALLIERFGLKR